MIIAVSAYDNASIIIPVREAVLAKIAGHMPSAQRRNLTRYWCDPRVPGLSLLDADFTDHDYRPHVHSERVVAVTESGGAHAAQLWRDINVSAPNSELQGFQQLTGHRVF